MAWYGSHVDASKKLDQLIDQSPSLQQLLNYPDFIQQLKAYNPKLLDYLTNSFTIIAQLINYITIPPKQNDTQQRKYRLPTLCMQMIQSESMSIINSFFKQDQKRKIKFFNIMFQELLKISNRIDGQVLPILAGYFLRVNICLLNNKYKQTIDSIYENSNHFQILLENCFSLSVTNTLQVYLNLDLTKNSVTIPQRLNVKLNVIDRIVKIIDQSIQNQKNNKQKLSQNQSYYNLMRVQNLSSVLIQLLQKYYLIADGKQMVDQILNNQQHIRVFFKTIFNQNNEISMSLLNILISIVKYYSFSSFNSQQWSNPQQNKKNQQRLQNQHTVSILCEILPNLIYQLNKCSKFTLYYSKIVQLINMMIGLNSHKIFNCVKNFKYFQTLIQLLFRFQYCSILGMMIEKLFLMIFRTQKLINQEIKHYIFCQAKIIDLTAGRYLNFFTNDQQIASSMAYSFRRKAFFGHLMKLMKIYSGIQTTDQDIINAIKNKSDIWNKISRVILKPYQAINIKQLGTYDNLPEVSPNQYSVKTTVGSNGLNSMRRQNENNKLIDQINREEAIQNLKTLETNLAPENKIQAQNLYHPHKQQHSQNQSKNSTNDDEFFSPPTQNTIQKAPYPSMLIQKKSSQSSSKSEKQEKIENSPTLEKKSSSYTDFLQKQKVKAGNQISKQRSRSKERALSKGKTKITSPSPTKRVNKWAQGGDQKPSQKQKISLTSPVIIKSPSINGTVTQPKNLPKIPMHKKGLNVSSNNNNPNSNGDNSPKQDNHNKSMQIERNLQSENITNQISKSKSMMNLQDLKKVKIIYQFDIPGKRQYRKITQQDKSIFDMLGISY